MRPKTFDYKWMAITHNLASAVIQYVDIYNVYSKWEKNKRIPNFLFDYISCSMERWRL